MFLASNAGGNLNGIECKETTCTVFVNCLFCSQRCRFLALKILFVIPVLILNMGSFKCASHFDCINHKSMILNGIEVSERPIEGGSFVDSSKLCFETDPYICKTVLFCFLV